jgi:hypothetical protein
MLLTRPDKYARGAEREARALAANRQLLAQELRLVDKF